MQKQFLCPLQTYGSLKRERRTAEMGCEGSREVKHAGMAEPREIKESKSLFRVGYDCVHCFVQAVARENSALQLLRRCFGHSEEAGRDQCPSVINHHVRKRSRMQKFIHQDSSDGMNCRIEATGRDVPVQRAATLVG